MKSNVQTPTQKRELSQIQDNYNDDYWSKKYGVSAEDLKKTGHIGLPEKIIEANIQNKNFSVNN